MCSVCNQRSWCGAACTVMVKRQKVEEGTKRDYGRGREKRLWLGRSIGRTVGGNTWLDGKGDRDID